MKPKPPERTPAVLCFGANGRVLVPGSAIQQYYYAGGQRIAQRVLANGTSTLYYLHGDHLGSTSATTCGTGCGTAGALIARQLYYPFGKLRPGGTGTLPTDFGFTGQRRDDTGWMFYNARYYDPELARFTSADSIVPDPSNPQAFNRYAYANNNPVRYTDPTGHCAPACAVPVIGFVALVVVVAIVFVPPDVRQAAAESFSRVVQNAIDAVSAPLQVRTLRGLTSDEQRMIDKVDGIIADAVPNHPDLWEDVQNVLNGLPQSGGNSNHVKENRDYARGLDNGIAALERLLKRPELYTEEALKQMQDALNRALENRQALAELLGKLDPTNATDEEVQNLIDEAQQ